MNPLRALILLLFASPHDSGSAVRSFEVTAPHLTESSGLAASRGRPGVYFTHNDSGGKPELFSFSDQGELLAVHPVLGAEAIDWEDLASGPCPPSVSPSADCLFIGDIGDNRRERPFVTVYAVAEPVGAEPATPLAAWVIRYPDGPRNAETLLYDPWGRRLLLVTKERDGRSELFRFPETPNRLVPHAPAQAAMALEPITRLVFEGESDSERSATGGAWSQNGLRVAIRTYSGIHLWSVNPAQSEACWQKPAIRLPAPAENQGEALAFSANGEILTTSEGDPMPVTILPAPVSP